MIKDHMPWVIVLLLTIASGLIAVSHQLVRDGEARMQKVELQIDQLEKFCCSEIEEYK